MSLTALLKTSHEDLFLQPGFYLACQYFEGWVVTRITSREWSNLRPISAGALLANTSLAAWNTVTDAAGTRFLEPYVQDFFYHIFWGCNTPLARIYVQHPTGQDMGNLITGTRAVAGDVGYIEGHESPYDGPFSVKTELLTVNQRYPAFQVSNVTFDPFANVTFNFQVMKYRYKIIKDTKLIDDLLTGRRQCKRITIGRADPEPTRIPDWLLTLVGAKLLRWTKESVMEIASLATEVGK